MIIGSIKEHITTETRVSLTPQIVQKLTTNGHTVLLEKDYGIKSGFSDKEYQNANADIIDNSAKVYQSSKLILQILPPSAENLSLLTKGQTIAADFRNETFAYLPPDLNIIRLELVPRTSAAQSIDILSAQNTIRGYMSALYALFHSPRIAPQMVTAAASLKAANALVIGTSVTGLQAASTFKRLGCRVTITDINEKSQELAQSVGADFKIAVNQEVYNWLLPEKNFILSTAAAPNGNTPKILTEQQLTLTAKGAVIVDTTTQNIDITENTQTTKHYHFYRNLYFEHLAPESASTLWANNMYNLISLIVTENNEIDLSLNYIAPMVYTSPLITQPNQQIPHTTPHYL